MAPWIDGWTDRIRYELSYDTTSKTGWLAEWNSTQLLQNPYNMAVEWQVVNQVFNGSGNYFIHTSAPATTEPHFISPYTWNVTLSNLNGLVLNAAAGVNTNSYYAEFK